MINSWFKHISPPCFITLSLFATTAHAISVEGDTKYKTQVDKCLKLLSSKAWTEYKFVEKYIGIISQNSRSGMRAWEDPPRYNMSDRTAFHSVTWCAGTIAHDAYHSFLFQKHKPSNGGKPPYDKWGGFDAEKLAIDYQIKVMKKIGASDYDINYLEGLDGKHGDVNKDGKLDYKDYEQRSW